MYSILIFLIFYCFSVHAEPTVGAIRWDAWTGGSVGSEVEKSLGPLHWHYRVPFFGEVISDNVVTACCTTQACVDQEIHYANHAKLDYFAFLLYDDSYLMSIPLHKYLSSSYKSEINLCVIAQADESVDRVLGYMEEPTYQTVLGGRPLVYTFRCRDNPTFAQILKDSCASKEWPEPYIVDLHWTAEMPPSDVFDAITCYWYGSSWGSTDGAPYTNLNAYAKSDWNQRLENGAKQVLQVSTGCDGRPRIENPVSWINDPVSMYEKYYETPTLQEIVNHLQEAFDFIEAHPDNCEANTVLMYAWNENDEGGWLTPVLPEYGGTERVDALRSFLIQPGEYTPEFDSIAISPYPAIVIPNRTIELSAEPLDQYAKPFEGQLEINWSLTGDGTLSSSTGTSVNYSASGVANQTIVSVTASSGKISNTISIEVTAFGKLTGTLFGEGNPDDLVHTYDKAVDSDLSTYAELTNYPRYFGYKFDQVMLVSLIKYYPRPDYQARMPEAEFQVSDDGENWTTVYTVENEPPSGEWTIIDFSLPYSATWIRMYHPSNWLTIAEVEFWGEPENLTKMKNIRQSCFSGKGFTWNYLSKAGIEIDIMYPGQYIIDIINLTGRVVESLKGSTPKKHIIMLKSSGVYLLNFITCKDNFTDRIVNIR